MIVMQSCSVQSRSTQGDDHMRMRDLLRDLLIETVPITPMASTIEFTEAYKSHVWQKVWWLP